MSQDIQPTQPVDTEIETFDHNTSFGVENRAAVGLLIAGTSGATVWDRSTRGTEGTLVQASSPPASGDSGLLVRPITADSAVGGTISALNGVVDAAISGRGSWTVDIRGTFSAGSTVNFEGSVNGGVNWFPVAMSDLSGGNFATSAVGGAAIQRVGNASGLNYIRVRANPFAGGDSISVSIRASDPPPLVICLPEGPLTDAQLRASAVPVSGPLTDAQLRASGVPVTLTEPISVDDNAGSLTVDEVDSVATATLTAVDQAVTLTLPGGDGGYVLDVRGTFSAGSTINYEATIDGTNWFAVQSKRPDGTGTATSNAGGAAIQRRGPTAGFSAVRARVNPFAGGDSIVCVLRSSRGVYETDFANAGIATTTPSVTTSGLVVRPISYDVEDVATPADPQGTMLMARRRDLPIITEVSAEADKIAVNATAKGALHVRTNSGATGVSTQVAASASSVTLQAANQNRSALTIYNDSTAILYVNLEAAAASTTNFTVKLFQDDYYEVPDGYTGEVRGIWASATGNAYVTEIA